MKKLLKNLFIPLLANQKITSLAHRLFNCGTPIFMLHRIANYGEPKEGRTNPEHLRRCLEYLQKNNYTCISLKTLVSALYNNESLPAKSVCFTMDDGYLDQAEIAAPIFIEYNYPLTFFVITGMLDQTIWPWDAQASWIIESSKDACLESSTIIKKLGINADKTTKINKREFRRSIQNTIKKMDAESIPKILQQLADAAKTAIPQTAPSDYQAMTWDTARELEKQGICFAPHSVSHHILSRLDKKSMEQEINQAWKTISKELKNPLKIFCYPNGSPADFDEREIRALKKADYLGAVSTVPDFVTPNKKHHNYSHSLPRLALPDDMTDFIQYCSWMESLRSTHFKIRYPSENN